MRNISATLPDETYNRVLAVAKQRGTNRSDAVRLLVTLGLSLKDIQNQAAATAEEYEAELKRSPTVQRRTASRGDLAMLKAHHWRILEKLLDIDAEATP